MRISDWSSDVCSSDLLSAYATKAPLEEWAGPVAGSSALHNRGIARSTLHDWQKRGQVVALLAGARKHAFPLEQFVDGRPMEGIADRKSVVEGKSGSVRVVLGGLRIIKKKKKKK